MPTLIISNGAGKPLTMVDLATKYGPYKVGRWCKAPEVPDRCDFCPLADIRPAVGWRRDGEWRRGFCEQHRQEG